MLTVLDDGHPPAPGGGGFEEEVEVHDRAQVLGLDAARDVKPTLRAVVEGQGRSGGEGGPLQSAGLSRPNRGK